MALKISDTPISDSGSESSSTNKSILEKIAENLSIFLSSNPLDIINVGIHIYHPFSIEETPEKKPKVLESKSTTAISLRSKSTRNLNIRDNSYTNLLKSFRLVLEKVENDEQDTTANIELGFLDELNKSKSRQRLTPITEKRRKKSSHESKKNQHILQDVYNIKNKKSNKSFRNASKETPSRRSQAKFSRINSLTPSKYY